MSLLGWLLSAARLIAALKPRYWALLALIFSGRAMLPYVPQGPEAAFTALAPVLEIFLFLWLPYLLIRAMAGEARPARPTRAFLLFAVAASGLGAAELAAVAAAEALAAAGAAGENSAGLIPAARLFAAMATVRLLPLLAGTATARLSPAEPRWWQGLAGQTLALMGAIAVIRLAPAALGMLIGQPSGAFTLAAIFQRHALQAVALAQLLFVAGLSLAAWEFAAQLPGRAPAR